MNSTCQILLRLGFAVTRGSRPQRVQQRLGGFFEELFLAVAADLHQRDVGETRFPVRPHRIDDRVEVGAAGDALGDIFGPDELGGAGKARRRRQVGVDTPPAGEPTELIVCALDGRVPVGVPTDRDLPDDPAAAGQAVALTQRCASRARSSPFGSTAIRWSASRPNLSTAFFPPTAIPMPTGTSGTSHNRAESTW